MREILFAGKMKAENGQYKKGEWVYGDLVRLVDGKKTITCIYGKGEVDAKTVGQYSGFTDKNGNKIFDGRILKWTNEDGKDVYTAVGFKNGCFVINPEREETEVLYDYLCRDMEIAGNIYDNPELLK